jgi:NADH-quinone oxidoreductase subunit J
MLAEIGFLWRTGLPSTKYTVPSGYAATQFAKYGVVGAVAKPLYQDYSLAFELTSVLLLVAIAGAVVLGRRKENEKVAVEDVVFDGAKTIPNTSSNGAH